MGCAIAEIISLGLIVGGLLAVAEASYQGVFRNPLADPYLLGVAAGAGLGATIIVSGATNGEGMFDALPIAAFLGSWVAVAITLAVGKLLKILCYTASLLLSFYVAVASLFTAIKIYIQQRESATLRQVYSWIWPTQHKCWDEAHDPSICSGFPNSYVFHERSLGRLCRWRRRSAFIRYTPTKSPLDRHRGSFISSSIRSSGKRTHSICRNHCSTRQYG